MKHLALLATFFLCVAALVFPFSVAVTNIALGVSLGSGVLSGVWWHGVRQCWSHYHSLSIAFCTYFALMLLGMAWSLDRNWGLHVLSHQWFWLLIPLIMAALADNRLRRRFLVTLSIGLTLNLFYCELQAYGIINLNHLGSSAIDATGHIGHIGFGVVYGVWGAWLLYLGWVRMGAERWLAWMLGFWSYMMIFLAQGRSGYIVAVVLFIAVVVKMFRRQKFRRAIVMISLLILMAGLVSSLTQGKERWKSAWDSLMNQGFVVATNHSETYKGNSIDQRVYMIAASIKIWRSAPWLGVGTGGLPEAASRLAKQGIPGYNYSFSHPHNQYLLVLVRWGMVGPLALIIFLLYWVREGFHANWQQSWTSPFVALSGLALLVDSFFAPSMEEHFPAIFAVLLLGLGLSTFRDEPSGLKEASSTEL